MARFGTKLSSCSIAQLSELLEDDEKLNQIVQDMEEVKEVQQTKEMTMTGNRSLAEQNLQLQPALESKKSLLTEGYRSLQDMFESYQLRKSTLDHNSGDTSLDTLLALLQTEGAKIEEETENLADAFLEGSVPLDAFVDDYQNKRKLAHLRRVKIEKLQELVLKSSLRPPLTEPVHCLATNPAPLQDTPPAVQPRRPPPLPPIRSPSVQHQPSLMFAYPGSSCPPVPPRMGQTQLGYPALVYPSNMMPQYLPPVPQRAPPRLTPQPGFIIQ